MKIIRTNNLGKTPAKAIRKYGIIFINADVFDKLPKHSQEFILEHEKAHINFNTKDEFLADEIAFYKIAGKKPNSLKNSILALNNGLTFDRDEHMLRLKCQIIRALKFDWLKNKNIKALKTLKKYQTMEYTQLLSNPDEILRIEENHLKNTSNFNGNANIEDFKAFRKNPEVKNLVLNISKAENNPKVISLLERNKPPIKDNQPHFANTVTKPLFYNPDAVRQDYIENQIIDTNRYASAGAYGSGNYNYDAYSNEDSFNQFEPSNKMMRVKDEKFLGMPKKTGITVTVIASLLVIGTVAYFIFKK